MLLRTAPIPFRSSAFGLYHQGSQKLGTVLPGLTNRFRSSESCSTLASCSLVTRANPTLYDTVLSEAVREHRHHPFNQVSWDYCLTTWSLVTRRKTARSSYLVYKAQLFVSMRVASPSLKPSWTLKAYRHSQLPLIPISAYIACAPVIQDGL